jgi:hypothetical protein
LDLSSLYSYGRRRVDSGFFVEDPCPAPTIATRGSTL